MRAFPILVLTLFASTAQAQRDTSGKKEINITATFQPTLKDAAKINFNPTPPTADTNRPRLTYSLPNQNLNFAFQPGSLKPLALQSDTGTQWNSDRYLKVGYGNLKSPFIQAGLAFSDGKTSGVNVHVKHNSSQGKIRFQDYSSNLASVNAFLRNQKNLEFNARLTGQLDDHNRYGGYYPANKDANDSIAVNYQAWKARLGFHNINKTEFGLSFAPELRLETFRESEIGARESISYFHLPLQKTLGEVFAVDLALTANISKYKPSGGTSMSNNYVSVAPSLLFKKPNVNVQMGIRPSWDNGDFKLFPNVVTEFKTKDNQFSFQFGWSGYVRNSGYQYLANFNPWIWQPNRVNNTRVEERYIGIKGSLGDHFSYSAKAANNILNNQPLFTNDTLSGRSFVVVNEPELKVFSVGGELGYTVGEKFSVVSNLSLNRFKLKQNAKAWGLLPLEWKTDVRIQVLKDLYVNTTLYAFDGPLAQTKSGRVNLPASMDLSSGLEFRVYKNIKIWGQFNNIFNKEYQRWNQYPVYGFNFLGGVVFSFAQ